MCWNMTSVIHKGRKREWEVKCVVCLGAINNIVALYFVPRVLSFCSDDLSSFCVIDSHEHVDINLRTEHYIYKGIHSGAL
jgi:hypothetical protein